MGTCMTGNENLLEFYTLAPWVPHLNPNASPASHTHVLEWSLEASVSKATSHDHNPVTGVSKEGAPLSTYKHNKGRALDQN